MPLTPSESPSSLELIRQYWSERYGREISEQEAREIVSSVGNYFRILREWDEKKPRDCQKSDS